eukprot:Amastigsp_a513639_14.p3 type:complete len:145 gc:universal Amastigsp_a513639_14:283-717(+)
MTRTHFMPSSLVYVSTTWNGSEKPSAGAVARNSGLTEYSRVVSAVAVTLPIGRSSRDGVTTPSSPSRNLSPEWSMNRSWTFVAMTGSARIELKFSRRRSALTMSTRPPVLSATTPMFSSEQSVPSIVITETVTPSSRASSPTCV